MKIIPQDAMAAAAVRLDLAKAYAQIKASLIRIGGNDASRRSTSSNRAPKEWASQSRPCSKAWATSGCLYNVGLAVAVSRSQAGRW